jgi:DNA polymerase III delta subunit
MLYTIVGTDTEKKLQARERVLSGFLDRELLTMNDVDFNVEHFHDFLNSGDLFSKKYVVVLDSLIASDYVDDILDSAEAMSRSENIFIISEIALLKSPSDVLKKHSETFQTFDLPKEKEEKFNIFSVTDAFGARDKKTTWVLMQRAMRRGVGAEELLNILIWQVKNLLAVSTGQSVLETGLAPFVFNKSKSYAKNFGQEELHDISTKLVTLFHESHLGLELEPNLELLLLKSL